MKSLRFITLLAVVFFSRNLAAQESDAADSIPVDSTVKLQWPPKLMLTAGLSPFFLFSPECNANLGLELKIHNNYALNVYAGTYYHNPFFRHNEYKTGWFIDSRLKRYSQKHPSTFLALGYRYHDLFHQPMVEFVLPSGQYFRRASMRNEGHAFTFSVGKLGKLNVGRRLSFLLEFSIGASIEFQQNSAYNLNAAERNFLSSGKASGFQWERLGTHVAPTIPITLRIHFPLLK